MKNKNTWVFYFFILLFTTILSIQLVWRLTPVKAEMQASIEEQLKPFLGESFKMDDFSLGYGYISFYGITAGDKDRNYSLHLDEIRIGYSLHKILLHRLNPLQVIESVTFRHPRLTVWTGKRDSSAGRDSLDVARLLSGFQQFAEIDRIFVQGGELFWGKSPDSLSRSASGVSGVVYILPSMQAEVRLAGSLFGAGEANLDINGTINLQNRSWMMNVAVKESRVNGGLPILNGESFRLTGAVIKGNVRFSCPSFNVRALEADGSLDIKNLQALSFDQKVTADEFRIEFAGQQMILTPVSGLVADGRFVLNGNLGTIFDPGLYFTIDFDNYSAENVQISVPILDLLHRGKLQGHLIFHGPARDLTITGKIYSSKLYYAFVPFYRSSLDFVFRNKIWTFRKIKTHSIGMDHTGTGAIDFNRMKMALNLTSERPMGPETFHIIRRLNNAQMKYLTTMHGDFASLTFTGRVRALFTHPADTVLAADIDYRLVDDRISLHSVRTFPSRFSLSASVSKLWTDPTFDILELENVPFDSLSDLAIVRALAKKVQSDFYFSGPINYPTAKVNFLSRRSGNVIFSLIGSAVNLIEPPFKFQGTFIAQTKPRLIRGRFLMADKGNAVFTRLRVPDMLDGTLTVGYDEKGPFEGQLHLSETSLHQYLGKFPGVFTAISEGTIAGDMTFSGTAGSPQFNFDFTGNDFIINQNGYYSGRFSGEYRQSRLHFSDAWIRHNNRPVFSAQFDMDFNKDMVDAQFKGEKIESNFIAATVFKNPNLVRGDLQYEIAMKGPVDRPDIWGTIILDNGQFLERPFHSINIIFQDSIPTPATLWQIKKHLFRIQKFIYVDPSEYSVEASGLLPVNPKERMDLRFNVRSNVLAELPVLIPFFRHPNSLGELDLHVTGTRESPHLQGGYLKIYNGTLKFESILPPLTELKVDIELPEGSDYVRIKRLEGKLLDRPVKIYNVPAARVGDGKELRPWYFDELGMNLGILVLETDPRGIPLSIPGLMREGDIGYFAADGMTAGEKFYFAGPVDQPHVRGKVTLHDARVTYPFLEYAETSLDEDDRVMDFLMNIDWDVLAVSGMGNRYFVDVPAVLGRVYLDLNIDEVSKGLHFMGRLADEGFRVEGQVESTRGSVEYLDMNFRVDRFGAIFNRFELYPEVYGRARTTVRDSTNFPRDIFLELYAIDPETKKEVSRGRWEDFRFKLVSSDPTIGETQEKVLAYLGYSVANIGNKAREVGLTLTENYLFRPLMRPLERKLERTFRLDYVHLQSNIASNLLYFGFHNRPGVLPQQYLYRSSLNNNLDPALLLFQSSEITLGKYLLKDIYFTYSGQLVSVYDESKLGLNHRFGLEYRIFRNLLLEVEYDKFQFDPSYYSRDRLHDFKIRFRHSFNF